MLAQSTVLSSVDDSTDPLGPLGVADPIPSPAPAQVDQAPTPPRKEPSTRQVSAARPASAAGEDGDNLSIRSRGPAPAQASVPGSTRQMQPSMSVEQAAKPSFDISVGDPHKVGDLTSSHIVYQVRTKVNSKAETALLNTDDVLDHFQGLQATRVCCLSKISRLPVALQLVAQ